MPVWDVVRKGVKNSLYQVLDSNGDGTGNTNGVGDYSTVPGIFYIQPPEGVRYQINRMIVHAETKGGIDAGFYGNGIKLDSGIIVRTLQNNRYTNLTANHPVKNTGQWGMFCYDVNILDKGKGNNHMLVRWTFARAGYPIPLVGDTEDRLEVVLRDDFSKLEGHHFVVEGYTDSTGII